ncbi:hypothetical protein RUM43_002706 [Polyplax serrata]|uniref:TOG domain-containing protein n=1 Tax=Polyplax serrata TaxID=468196 RepID=A0AAN8NTY9_POLSC
MWMKLEQNDKENKNGKSKQAGFVRCPMCKGRGFFEPTPMTAQNLENFPTEREPNNPVKLPQLTKASNKQWQKPRSKYSLPSINNVKNLPEQRPVEWLETRKELHDGPNKQFGNSLPKRPEMGMKDVTSHRLSVASSNESFGEANLLPSPRTPKNPQETLKLCLSKLKSNNWNETVNSLKEIVQLSRFHPQILEPSMVLVYRALIVLLKSFRSVVARTACQASNELFATMANTQRPEFDEVVGLLLQKTADTNKVVRRDANEALDTMILNIPPNHVIRALTNKGISHKSHLVRGASARLLVCMTGVLGIDAIFSGNKETRGRVISAGASFMQDSDQEVRNFGRRLMKMLMSHDDFEEVLQTEVNEAMIKRIEKTLVSLKYKT